MANQPSDSLKTTTPVSMLGIGFAALAAIGYTSANFFMRCLADSTPSELVVTCKAGFTALVFTPWLGLLIWKRKQDDKSWRQSIGAMSWEDQRATPPREKTARYKPNIIPPLAVCLLLVFAAVVVQFGGNLMFQWSLGLIGMALSVPLLMSVMIIAGAGLGWIFLKEPVAINMWIAIGLFVASIFILSQGIYGGGEMAKGALYPKDLTVVPIQSKFLGILTACAAGLSYAVLGIAVRTSMKYGTPSATPMVFVGVIGAIGLGALTLVNHGPQIFTQTNWEQWQCLLGAAVSNTIAFLFLTQAFKFLPIVYVNATNVAQIAMAALIGIAYFHESFSWYLVTGILLMSAGYVFLAAKSLGKKEIAAAKIVGMAESSTK